METKSALDEPWLIYTDSGTFHSGHISEGAATAAKERLNKEAEKLGVTARYIVEENKRGVAENGGGT